MGLDPKTFGRRITERRKELGFSQGELAKLLGTSTSVVGRYERAEMTPSVEVAARVAEELKTTVGYLLGETEQADLLKDPAMLRRLDALGGMEEEDRATVLRVMDSLIRDSEVRRTYTA